MILKLARVADTLGPREGADRCEAVVDLVRVVAAERLAVDPAKEVTRRSFVGKVSAYINAHLTDPDLTPERIARAHQMSAWTLHLAFQREPLTVYQLIRSRRLEHARTELARRPGQRVDIAAVAQRWGFPDQSHFSRLFRSAFGLSPTEWRRSQPPP